MYSLEELKMMQRKKRAENLSYVCSISISFAQRHSFPYFLYVFFSSASASFSSSCSLFVGFSLDQDSSFSPTEIFLRKGDLSSRLD